MVCSACHGKEGPPGHNIRRCPKMEVGAEDMCQAVISGATQATAIGALTAICPPLGGVAAGAMALKGAYEKAKELNASMSSKTQTERKMHMKKLVISAVADKLD